MLGELEEDEDEDEEKVTPVRPGGLVAVFCPVRLLRQTGQLSCFAGTEGEKGAVQRLVGRESHGSEPPPAPCPGQGRGPGACLPAHNHQCKGATKRPQKGTQKGPRCENVCFISGP